jgi:hypothetical protein
LETRERLESALGFYMVIAWRVLFLTMLGRDCPEMPCDTVFADEEWKAVYRFGVTNGWLFANPGLQGYRASVGHQPDADVTLVIFVTRKREADAESRQDMALFQSLAELLAPDNPPALSIR